jgi:glyoxylase-like metal-dependent hydrolase (beta-lactamase superfamily II)
VRFEPVADGVFASIAEEGDFAVGNAGFVDLGGETIVFDTHNTPTAGRRLREAAEAQAPARTVVLSHWHGDHVCGSGVFDAHVVATDRTAELMHELTGPRVAQLKQAPPEDLEGTPFAGIPHSEVLELELHFPDETFGSERSFEGSVRTARALTFGGGHTASDAVLWLADERILFAADLVVVDSHAWVGHGDVDAWPAILARIAALEPRTIVPGHGPVAGPESIDFMQGYLEALCAAQPGDPNPFPDLAFADGWERNLEALAQAGAATA